MKQGEDGIWCVERWRDQAGNVYPYFPLSKSPSREYYAALQSKEEARRQDSQFDPEKSYFNPEYVAFMLVREILGHDPHPASFERVENSDLAEELFKRSSGDSVFSLGITGPASWDILRLGVHPTGFPFGLDLTVDSSESFEAEGLGQVTIVATDGFQLKYLHSKGLYVVYCIRTVREGHWCAGVAVGDLEDTIWNRWQPEQLKKVDRLSFEDEEWFGESYDYGCVHVQDGGTKSLLYLIRDGRIAGIGLVDGIFGSMY